MIRCQVKYQKVSWSGYTIRGGGQVISIGAVVRYMGNINMVGDMVLHMIRCQVKYQKVRWSGNIIRGGGQVISIGAVVRYMGNINMGGDLVL